MRKVVILGTGGTIAGTGSDPARSWHYVAAQRDVGELLAAVPELAAEALEWMQVAQIDSKDMRWAVWRALAAALDQALARTDVAGVVVTHGTDTLEETAWLLQALHDGCKPVVLTAAMRPATAPDADGPANLRDAVRVARAAAEDGLGGVVAVLGGRVWPGAAVRKVHTLAVDAFNGGEVAPLADLRENGMPCGAEGWSRPWPPCDGMGWGRMSVAEPPRVEVVTSHADADGWVVDALCAHGTPRSPLRGLIVAGTGHGTVHEALEAALRRAEAQGVAVWRSTRVAKGGVMAREGDRWPACGPLTPAQARVALVLALLQKQRPAE